MARSGGSRGKRGDLAEAALDLLALEELDHVVLAAVLDLLVCRTCNRRRRGADGASEGGHD
jgi:hypothetical protein